MWPCYAKVSFSRFGGNSLFVLCRTAFIHEYFKLSLLCALELSKFASETNGLQTRTVFASSMFCLKFRIKYEIRLASYSFSSLRPPGARHLALKILDPWTIKDIYTNQWFDRLGTVSSLSSAPPTWTPPRTESIQDSFILIICLASIR
jgi:hypothetical protein